VHATTRSAAKAEYLTKLPGAAERLTIFEGCDLQEKGSFDEAIRGCRAVLHTASPFFMQGGSRENLVEPAVAGTENVLDACKRLGVQKVTLTASTACVYVDYGTKHSEAVAAGGDGHTYTENDWSPADMLEEKSNWYCLSKVKAEQLAWELSRQPDCPFELCVLNPCLILGPMLPGQSHLNTSSNVLVGYMDGSRTEVENACKAVVDVRDCAEAHIAPLERDKGWGRRFLLIAGSPPFSEVAAAVRTGLEAKGEAGAALVANVPTAVSAAVGPTILGPPPPGPVLYDAEPSRTVLGITYRSVEEMTVSSVGSMVDNGFSSSAQYTPGK
jgi:dihydroflavonol-4-reductase